jgi:amidohydrolase
MLKETIQQLVWELHHDTVVCRRHLHAYPELSFKEYNTSSVVAGRLSELDVPF